MPKELIIEAASLYIPLCSAMALALWLRPPPRVWAGVIMAITWQLAILPWFNLLAIHLGWWEFETSSPIILSIPVSLYLGWAVLWGVCSVFIQESYSGNDTRIRSLIITAIFIGFFIFDLIVMPLMEPVLQLGDHWLAGELLLVTLVLMPSLVVSRSVVAHNLLAYRTTQISLSFVILLLTIVPLMTSGTSLERALAVINERHLFLNWIFGALIILAAIPAVSAVRQFAIRGKGTPIPFDPPTQLVTDGVYSYCANAMQLSIFVVLILWGWMWHSWICIAVAVISIFYSQGLAVWSEGADLLKRYSHKWRTYQKSVPRWRFSWKPNVETSDTPNSSKLYISRNCNACSELRKWFGKHDLRGLELHDAEDFTGNPLTRVTYIYPCGTVSTTGVSAIASAFQHIHLGYAYLGWLIQIPGFCYILQAAMDVSGAGEIPVRKSSES